jgi:hypothetical protein
MTWSKNHYIDDFGEFLPLKVAGVKNQKFSKVIDAVT